MKKIIGILFLLTLLSLVVSCTSVSEEKQCVTDADCVAATCCHATDAVNLDFRPDCSSTLCTAVCEPGTLDCNQGEAMCVKGSCEAVITG